MMSNYRQRFLEDNFIVLPKAFSPELAADWIADFNSIHGIDPNNASTWPDSEGKMYERTQFLHMREFSPKAYDIICEFLNGEDKIDTGTLEVGNNYNINFQDLSGEPWKPPGPNSPGYHKDGWFFKHFLDSPEQALLCLIIWSDIGPKSGGTFYVPDSVDRIVDFLYEHPDGAPHKMSWADIAKQCSDFREVTASAGDIIILHPFMLHSRSQNPSGRIRYMNNKCVMLKDPLQFYREDGKYNILEEGIRNMLGLKVESFQITSERIRTPDMSPLILDEA
jgi:hypothetical protein